MILQLTVDNTLDEITKFLRGENLIDINEDIRFKTSEKAVPIEKSTPIAKICGGESQLKLFMERVK